MLDDRIKKISRELVRDYYRALNRQSLQNIRNLLWFGGDTLDQFLRKTKRSKNARRVSKIEIKQLEDGLKELGDDGKMLEVVEAAASRLSCSIRELSRKPLHPSQTFTLVTECFDGLASLAGIVDRATVKEKMRLLFRDKPGRRPDEAKQGVFQKALLLVDQGMSYDKIACRLLPDVYAADRNKARQRIKAGVYRLRQKQSQKPS